MEPRAEPFDAFAQWWVDALGSGLIAVDAEGRIAIWNGAAARILAAQHPALEGELSGPLRGTPAATALRSQPALWERLQEALAGTERPGRQELTLVSADGEGATIGYSVAVVRDEGGAVRGAAVQFRDLTPFERRAAQERLRERLVALGETAAGLAHEIRNPLAAMEISAGLLKRRMRDDPDGVSMVEDLRAEVAHVAAVVNQSLEFVRPAVLEAEPVLLGDLIDEAVRVARARSDFRGAVERCDPSDPLPPLALDPVGMRGALTNLVLNAFEALAEQTAPPPRVTITLGSLPAEGDNPAEVRIEVRDNGPGVAAEHRERIFYPFFSSKQAGSGVGLAMAQKLVAEHGGRLELEGEGPGAVFRVHLPRSLEAAS